MFIYILLTFLGLKILFEKDPENMKLCSTHRWLYTGKCPSEESSIEECERCDIGYNTRYNR